MSEPQNKRFLEVCDSMLARAGWPPALVKATRDVDEYILGLRSGKTFYFASASDSGTGWVHLDGLFFLTPDERATPIRYVGPTLDRGVDVRLDEIAWVAEAPFGNEGSS